MLGVSASPLRALDRSLDCFPPSGLQAPALWCHRRLEAPWCARLRGTFSGGSMKLRHLGLLAAGLASVLLVTPAQAQTTGGISGTIVDANTQNPVADAVVIATSPALQGEQT